MLVPELFMRKPSRLITTGLRKTTVCEYIPESWNSCHKLAHVVMVKFLIVTKTNADPGGQVRSATTGCKNSKFDAARSKPSLYWPVSFEQCLAWLRTFSFFVCTWTTVSWGSSGFGRNTKGWNSQEKPNIHPFHTPQVKIPYKCHCSESKAKISNGCLNTKAEVYMKNLFGTWRNCQEVRLVRIVVNCYAVTNQNRARFYHFHFELEIKKNKNVFKRVTVWMFWIVPRVLWRDAVEEKQRERTVSEEEVCAGRERIHAVLLQQGRCEFPAALTQYNCTVRQKGKKNEPVTMHQVGKAWWWVTIFRS